MAKPKSALERLVETASPGPWTVEIGEGVRRDFAMIRSGDLRLAQIYSGDTRVVAERREANCRLAAQAPALAHELLDRRNAGQALAEAMEEYEHMWESANDCPECVGSLCADHALKLIRARTTAKDALARWAKLVPEEERDGVV